MENTEIRPGVFLRHHEAGICQGEVCPLHKPTNHALRSLPLDWDGERGVMCRLLGDVQVPDPDDFKILSGAKVIWQNSIRCNTCEIEVASTHRHDFKFCDCGKVAVDGGHSYLRRLGTDFTDTSVVINGSR